ncbi:RRNA methyltransferase 2, mitochondrial [Aphelenchoides fujianensis]|nr:RRNA methyltransferase 2, mitochondrial [Aphelenchoides fujianensis]
MLPRTIGRSSSSMAGIRSKNQSVKKFLDRQFRDEYVKLAREHNYRARSAFKLLQMHEQMRIFQKGFTVLDVGAAPGSWSQVAQQLVQPDGYVLGVDLLPVEPLAGVDFIQKADFTHPHVQTAVRERLGGRPVDVVLSDMAPNSTGTKQIDHIRIVDLCRAVLRFVRRDAPAGIKTSPSAVFLCKLWDGELRAELAAEIAEEFGPVKVLKPHSSRDHSAELYLFSRRMSHMLRQYQRVVSKWPLDRHKSHARNFKPFLERDIERLFGQPDAEDLRSGIHQQPPAPPNHHANLKALQELVENQHATKWPTHYSTGALGLTLEQLREVNSDAFRNRLGLGGGRWNWFTRYFRSSP